MLLICPKLARPQTFDLLNGKKRVTIPFHLVRNMVIIQLRVNNKGPFNFVLDTGVGIMVITDPALIDTLDLHNKRTIKLFGLGNQESIEAYVTSQLKIDLPDLESNNISAAILKKDQFGLSGYAGTPIHGLLGYDFFNTLAVKFSFADSTLTISKPENMHLNRMGERIPITIEDHKPYLHAHIKLPDGKQMDCKLIMDIGAGHPMSLENVLKVDGLPQKFISGNLGVGLTGPITGYLSRVSEFGIGKFKINQVITSFPDYTDEKKQQITTPRDGNLGLGILKRFQMVIDYPDSAIYLKKGELFNEPFEHDMSGMEYYEDSKHVFISRVEPGSPADIIGIQKDDEIVDINFKSIANLTLEQIDTMMRSKEDRTLLLSIYRNKEYIKFILTLRRRI